MLRAEVFEREIGGSTLSLEVGKVAGLANGAVTMRYGDTVILVTAVMSAEPREGIDFFPLTVDYEERLYAAGKIPGGWFRREGRPSTSGILTARLTDRPLRPLFPKGMRNDVQIVVTTLSADQENDPDILSVIGASAALSISDIPFLGPVSGSRVGYIERAEAMRDARIEVLAALGEQFPPGQLKAALDDHLKSLVRNGILNESQRPDGRAPADIRPISGEVGVLPRTHGSGLFTRGETQ